MKKEFIICDANYYNDGKEYVHQPLNITIGYVICGRRHHNCIMTFAQIVGFLYSEESAQIQDTEEQGFLTNTNRFVKRDEAAKIALEANQIIDLKRFNKNRLFSEDLY